MRFTSPSQRQNLPPLLPALPLEQPGLTPRELAARLDGRANHRSVTVALQRLYRRGILGRSEPVRTGRRGPATYRYWIRSRRVLQALAVLNAEGVL